MREHLTAIKQALRRLEKAEGRIARRNARRATFGAMRSLRLAVDRDYPAIEKPSKPVDRVGSAVRSETWRFVEYRIVKPGRKAWDRAKAEGFNAWFAQREGLALKPLVFDIPDGARILGQHATDRIRIKGIDTRWRGRDAELWRTFLHEVAHYRAHGHGAAFKAELVRVYRLWREWMTGRLA